MDVILKCTICGKAMIDIRNTGIPQKDLTAFYKHIYACPDHPQVRMPEEFIPYLDALDKKKKDKD